MFRSTKDLVNPKPLPPSPLRNTSTSNPFLSPPPHTTTTTASTILPATVPLKSAANLLLPLEQENFNDEDLYHISGNETGNENGRNENGNDKHKQSVPLKTAINTEPLKTAINATPLKSTTPPQPIAARNDARNNVNLVVEQGSVKSVYPASGESPLFSIYNNPAAFSRKRPKTIDSSEGK